MKQLNITFLLVVLMSMAANKTFAQDIEVENADGVTIYYNFINDNTELAVTYQGTSYSQYSDEYLGNVVIPSSVTYSGNTYPVTSIGQNAFRSCSGLTSIVIPNSVTSIGNFAFYNCTVLTSIEIPNSVTSIGDYAFSGCSGLTSVTIPNSVTSIGVYAFQHCSSLTSVTIGNGVTSIEYGAFQGCSGLTSIEIPNSVTSILGGAFENCSSLTSIDLPNGLNEINDKTFGNCVSLDKIVIPESVTTIGNKAFEGCCSLISAELPNVTVIYESAFANCGLKSLTLPSTIKKIWCFAFENCNNLSSIKCFATSPPECAYSTGDRTFSNYAIPLYVPQSSIISYKSTYIWRNFPIIRDINDDENDIFLTINDGGEGSHKLKVKKSDPTYTVIITPNSGWQLHNLIYNGENVTSEVTSDGYYTTPAINSNSILSIVYSQESSAVSSLESSRLVIYSIPNSIVVKGTNGGENISVYTLDGKCVKSLLGSPQQTEILLEGSQTYIIKVNNQVFKTFHSI